MEAFARSAYAAAQEIADLDEVNARAGRVVEEATRPPRRTGALARSQTVTAGPNGVTVAAGVRYATIVHWGAPRRGIRARPWLVDAVRLTADEVADLYLTHARETLRDNL